MSRFALHTRAKRFASIPAVQQVLSRFASWRELLAAPPAKAHLAQWYDNETFLAAAVSHYAAEGLSRGEAVALRGTPAHLEAVLAQLRRHDVDAEACIRSGQLGVADGREALDAATRDGRFDAARFERESRRLLERTSADPRFSRLRWWGEMSDLFFARGEAANGVLVEQIAANVARQHGAAMFCSFACDRFDPHGYAGVLADVCRTHDHVIPAEDYARHRAAVNRAVQEVLGEVSGPLLQSLALWKIGHECDLPSSQAVLFWLHETLPEKFDAVLSRARHHHDREAA
jgi:hypothetical protein